MKSNTQNAKIEAITEKTLVLGIDVGSETHYARAFDYRGVEYSKKPFKFSNTEAGFVTFKAWVLDIKEKHGKDKVIPGMEPTGHYWFNLGKFLQDNEMKPVLVNPHHVKKSKELDDNHPTKNDRKDPKVIAGLVREGRYMIPYLPDGVYADLRTASNIRFQLQAELTRIQNRINRWFNIYFPEYKTVYGKPDAKSGILILKEAPLPEDILTLGIDGVNQIWRDAKLRAVGKASLNVNRDAFLETKDKKYWWQMIQLLPSSYNQKRTIMLNYEVLAGIYPMRKNHKLDEWVEFCKWIESLPYSEIIVGKKQDD